MSDRNMKAQQAMWNGLRRFADSHANGLSHHAPDMTTAEFSALATVVFEDRGEWCWAVSTNAGEHRGGIELTKEAAQAAAEAAIFTPWA